MQRKILWKKWQDPLAPLLNGKPQPGYQQEEDEDDPDFHMARATFGFDEESYQFGDSRGNTGPAVVGPMGFVPLHEANLPSKLHNFWMGHANFDLTRSVVGLIKRVPGVEGLDVFSRYRFRLAIGRAFNEENVKREVLAACQPHQQAVASAEASPATVDPLETLQTLAARRFPHWSILVLADGKGVEILGGDSVQDVEQKVVACQKPFERRIVSWK